MLECRRSVKYANWMKRGKVIIQEGAMIQPHELKVGELLARTDHDVTFLSVGLDKSPDIMFRGKKWEIKSPKDSKRRTIENNIRTALKQSSNIIIDLSRINVSEDSCLRYVEDRKGRLGKKYSFLVIKKNKEIVEF